MPSWVCDALASGQVVTPVVPGERCTTALTRDYCVETFMYCSTWREVPIVIEGDLPSAADGAFAYAAGFVLILAPFIIGWSGSMIARMLRAFGGPQ